MDRPSIREHTADTREDVRRVTGGGLGFLAEKRGGNWETAAALATRWLRGVVPSVLGVGLRRRGLVLLRLFSPINAHWSGTTVNPAQPLGLSDVSPSFFPCSCCFEIITFFEAHSKEPLVSYCVVWCEFQDSNIAGGPVTIVLGQLTKKIFERACFFKAFWNIFLYIHSKVGGC